MIPVELSLQNFLSYGTEAPVLDFEQFHVACLSGRNGQGKSALLDAITWAIWGQARKSSGSGKPDNELLRIGTRDMKVELVFDVEGERYRVVRTYRESATGKTSTPGLELHLYEPGSDAYRALTGTNMKETQEHIDNVLGIDYDTFINSAFLLQGRSDEFTKKRPSERKEILAKILNLSRYERLAERAREREREARARLEQTQHELERLEQALQQEPVWKEQHQEVQQAIAARQEDLEAVRAREAKLGQRLAALEARAQEAASVRQSLQGLEARVGQLHQDAGGLQKRIEKAEALIAKRDEIQREYERYEALQREREELDEKRDLHRGVEKQIEQREHELRNRRTELEKRLHSVEAEVKSYRTALTECMGQLSREPGARKKLAEAQQAQQRLEELEEVRQKRDRVQVTCMELEQQLNTQREALNGSLRALEEQIAKDQEAVIASEKLKKEKQRLIQGQTQLRRVEGEREATREQGQRLAEAIRERRGQLSMQQKELAKHKKRFAAFQQTQEGVCPTCGTELTPAHRSEVEEHYRTTVAELEHHIDAAQAAIEEQEAQRDALRQRYRTLQERMDELASVPERLATVEEQIRAVQARREELADRMERAAELRRTLEEKDYSHDLRQQWHATREQLEALPFNDEVYERVRDAAAQIARYEDLLRDLAQVAGRREELERKIEQGQRDIQDLRKQLDGGSVLATLQEQIRNFQRQLEKVGFDPARFDEVRRLCKELSHAGARLKDLSHAQQNQVDWKEQLANVEERIKQACREKQELEGKLERIVEALDGRDGLSTAHAQAAARRQVLEEELNTLQVQLGELTARLEQARCDREALQAQQVKRQETDAERALYRQLKAAFGKNGIPSLIIEQTLPEIEERANDILDRLTSGRMRVRLETLKDKKTGGTMETLDIIITDEQGVPRPYETFSGGESFRVNFALRIALAQLLAERSGVRIRTLVIDEGFGTQDEQGVQRMVEAIQVIQDDFDKIIVITHLEDLKEAFPVRIEVEKDPVEGSRFELFGI